MSTKRALIVDDSRSARYILGRMLESFGLEVDAVESAELALTYLQTARPDVIFMDHLMPGMDGFAAVRVIKANPDTATIPVLMYTSQEGEMYLSQARALGAMGVLPKTLKHADVAEALEHLSLHTPVAAVTPRAPSTRTTAQSSPNAVTERDTPVREVEASSELASAVPTTAPDRVPAGLSVPQLAHRIANELRAELQRTNPATDPAPGLRVWALLSSVLALLLLGVLIYQQSQIQQQLSLLQPPQSLHAVTTSAPPTPPAQEPRPLAASSVAGAATEMEEVPYGEVPLSGARVERLRSMVDQLREQQIRGMVRVEVFLGDFCLTGNPVSGYIRAADELLVNRCDVVGNPFGDALTVQQRQSVAFANLVASINSGKGIKVQLTDGAHQPLVAYPPLSATLTAATWNRIAERNQRVEYTVIAAP